MIRLYLDTHSKYTTLVFFEDQSILKIAELETANNSSEFVMPLLAESLKLLNLKLKDIKEVIVVIGPGSFTGIRIGVTIAKTLAFMLNIPIRPLTSLKALALSTDFEEKTWFMVEEKNGFFAASFMSNKMQIDDYVYIPKKDVEGFLATHKTINAKVDYQKIIDSIMLIKEMNPHRVNPLYVKNIEVQS